jgi:hypothetical protein
MGACLACLERPETGGDPLLDAEARQRAAAAAEARQAAYNNSAHGKAAAKSAARAKAPVSSTAHEQRIHDIMN